MEKISSQTTTPVKSGNKMTDARMHEDMRDILKQNMAISEDIKKHTKYIKRYVVSAQIFGFIKLLIILIPIVLAIIYGPKFVDYIKNNPNVLFENSVFESFVDGVTGAVSEEVNENIKNIDVGNLKKIPKY